MRYWFARFLPVVLAFTLVGAPSLFANTGLSISLSGGDKPADLGIAIQLVFFMTLLSLAPTIIILMTSFTRIVIVLGFVRSALGVQSSPANQVIIGLALFLTFFLMGPVWDKMYQDAVKPYMDQNITSEEALDLGSGEIKQFMLKQTKEKDLEFFLNLSNTKVDQIKDIPLRVVTPSFILSELRTAFEMGFLIFIPFLVIDFIVAALLMAMGMIMMPPAIISMPFKILLFVLVDGWYLVVQSLVKSFRL